ncbi:MAG: hypothetical protein GTO41_02160, partial [Burkholderiales bacterium]|nr:hypothetical protein [Burkholderiales bacterium]
MTRLLTVFLCLLLLAAEPAPAEHHRDDGQRDMTLEARQVASDFVKKLGSALKQALTDSGPEGAISVCRDTAP